MIYLDIAKNLLQIDTLDEKGKFRTSIGRAYYSAFLLTRTKLERIGFKYGEKAQHSDVRKDLKTLKEGYMADQLKDLFDYRRDADYYLSKAKNKIFTKLVCEKYIIIAEQIIDALENIKCKK